MSGAGAFSRRAIAWIVSIAVGSFALAILLAAFGDDLGEPMTAGANTFSYSALGHRAFVELLERRGIEVVARKNSRSLGIGPEAPLIAAEPLEEAASDFSPLALFESAAEHGASFVLVLPKWRGAPRALNPRWVERVFRVPQSAIEQMLNGMLHELPASEVGIQRPDAEGDLLCTDDAGGSWAVQLESPQFLHPAEDFATVVRCGERILIAQGLDDSMASGLYVVSDPDLLNNHGLGQADHARLMHDLLVARLGARRVVFDETAHGFVYVPGLAAELLRFPLALAVLHGLILVGLVIWTGSGRFGKPLPVPAPLSDGKRVLIDNAAQLLSLGGHSALSLRSYLGRTLRRVAAHYYLPPNLPREEQIARLQHLSSLRGSKIDPRALAGRVDRLGRDRQRSADRVVRVAMDLYRWRQEMIDAGRRDP